jgi:hypothetical protein
MTLNDFLDLVGVKAGVIMAAFGGGLARPALFGTGGAGAITTLIAVLGGTLTAIFLGPVGPSYFGWQPSGQSTLAFTFLVGVFGMEILKRIGTLISQWSPGFRQGSKNDQ